eukprot:638315-Rhodomonas_salina.1
MRARSEERNEPPGGRADHSAPRQHGRRRVHVAGGPGGLAPRAAAVFNARGAGRGPERLLPTVSQRADQTQLPRQRAVGGAAGADCGAEGAQVHHPRAPATPGRVLSDDPVYDP